MWDNSTLPMYDGSFTSNIILLTLYLRLILYYVVLVAGVVFMVCFILSPFIIGYFGIRSLKIKIKNYSTNHKKDKNNKRRQKDITNGYLYRLENRTNKKK